MDRFIDIFRLKQKRDFLYLKSNMDRFIVKIPNEIDCIFDLFKIQYG